MPPELVGPTTSGKNQHVESISEDQEAERAESFPGVRSSDGCLPGKNPARDSGDGAKVAGMS